MERLNKERTLVIIKSGAVEKKQVGQIITRLEQHAKIVAIEKLMLGSHIVKEFYREHKEKFFFDGLLKAMSLKYVYPILLEGDDVIARIRKIVGATDPKKAEPETIRADFGESIEANAIHASDSPEAAKREINIFYPGK